MQDCTTRDFYACVAWFASRALGGLTVGLGLLAPHADAVTINWVTVGDPGNTADTTGDPNPAGAVTDSFRIMKYEWTNSQYVDFLNAVDPSGTNPNGIYNTSMGSNARGGISFDTNASTGSKYAPRTNMGDKPVNYVSWFDAARVVFSADRRPVVQGGVLQGKRHERRLLGLRHAERHGSHGGDGGRVRDRLGGEHGELCELQQRCRLE
jgi:hypothetical protein